MTGLIVILVLILVLGGAAFYASYSIASGVYVKAFCKNPNKGQMIALTFDDGPHATHTEKVLNVLQKNNLQATFFCIGKNIEGNEPLLKRIIEEGHCLGNHSFSHSFSFPLYTKQRMERDLKACEELIYQVTNHKISLFRPPFGVTNPTVAKALRAFEYQVIGWNIRSLDTCNPHEKVLKKIKRKLSPGSVILLHDALSDSDKLLEQVIDLVREEGYAIVPLDVLMSNK